RTLTVSETPFLGTRAGRAARDARRATLRRARGGALPGSPGNLRCRSARGGVRSATDAGASGGREGPGPRGPAATGVGERGRSRPPGGGAGRGAVEPARLGSDGSWDHSLERAQRRFVCSVPAAVAVSESRWRRGGSLSR